MSDDDVRMQQDFRMREAMNERIYAVLVSFVVLALVGGLLYGLWSSAQENRADTQETRLACIEAGGTWVGSPSEICFDPAPGGILLPPMEDESP